LPSRPCPITAWAPPEIRERIDARIAGYADPVSFYIEKLTEGIATIAAAFHPHRVIVRLSDFKSNEYRNLIGGAAYEPDEENPMIRCARYWASTTWTS